MSILVKQISKNLDFGQNFFESIDFGEKCREISNLVKFVEQFRFWTKLSKILDFGRNLQQMSILVKIYENGYFSLNY